MSTGEFMIEGNGDWKAFRGRFELTPGDEVDLHFGKRDRWDKCYDQAMWDVEDVVREAVRKAQENGRNYIMFRHGRSTSRPGQRAARSVVRGFMRSKEATPFIERSGCVQHDSVFVAKIRKKKRP